MSKSLHEVLEPLSTLNVDYNSVDISTAYLRISDTIFIEDYLNYRDSHNNYVRDLRKGGYDAPVLFHVVLSVRVDKKSRLVPFSSIYFNDINKGDDDNSDFEKKIKEELFQVGQSIITYTFSDFVSPFFREFSKECLQKSNGQESPRISFMVDYPKRIIPYLRFLPEFGQTNWLKDSDDDVIIEGKNDYDTKALGELENDLFRISNKSNSNKEASFVDAFSGYYSKLGINQLWYSFYNMDSDYESSECLTRLMIICTNKEEIEHFIFRQLNKIREIASFIRSRYTSDILRKTRIESEKSAKSAIMSRNMSHNLGSHVMAYLKQKLGSVASILNPTSEVLKYLYPSDSVQVRDVELPFLVGVGRFLGYLQERQDYIATISTDYIPSGAPVNLKDAIYDELNPDLRYMRHKKSPEKNRPMNILLDYIAKSEGLSRENMVTSGNNIYSTENDILFGFVRYYFEDKTIKKSIFGQGLTQKTMGSDNDALSVMRKINFNLPGGLIGRQAVFSIIENLIRNAAKHGDICGNLCFTFDVLDAANLESELALDSRIGEDWLPLYLNASDRNLYYIFTITDNLKYPASLAEKLRIGLEEDYVDPITGVMKESNKGLKEIRISASWLRGETDESLYQKYGHPNSSLLLPLVGIEVTKTDNHLRYLFALRKNHSVAILMEGLNSTDLAIFDYLGKDSPVEWTLCKTIADYKVRYKKECFRYIIVPNQQSYESIRPYAPNRVIIWEAGWREEKDKLRILNSLATSYKSTTDNDKLIFNKCKQTIYSQIFQLFAPESTDDFFVFDNASEECHIEERVYPRVKFGESKIDKNNVQSHIAKYVYRTHHATQALHSLYWRMRYGWEYNTDAKIWTHLPDSSKGSKLVSHAYSNIVAIDGITGDNSSDRLVRREPLTEEWYYSHLRALKTRVAVFDERIFKIVHNIDERVFLTPSASDVNAVIEMILLGDNNNPLYGSTLDKVFAVNKAELLSFMELTSNEDKIAFLKRQIRTDYKQSFFSSNTQSAAYHDKLVDVFTVIKGAFDDFIVLGCVSCGCTNDATVINNEEGKIYHYIFDKVATITKVQNKIVTTINDEYKDIISYDLLSIHQGLLDKIYEGFGIKDYDEGANDDNKRLVTESIYKGFITRASTKIIDCKYESVDKETINECFLPGMVIHSGRSKPTRFDMPQHLPFVQYSAIEHAVKDCKFTLVEILDYAKFE